MDDTAVIRWKYQRYMKNYLRCIKAVDENVGRVLDYLDQSGLAKNTIVIYSADQGFYLGEHGWFDKRWIFEESLSMPFLIHWPGVVKEGIRSKALIQNIDYAPTFLQMAGVPVPEDIQGRSMLPVLKNQGVAPADWRTGIYYAYYGENTHSVPMHDGVRTERYKIFFLPNSREWQLFDLEKDPKELKSVHADPAYAAILEDMKRRYYDLRRQYDVNNSIIPTQRMVEEWWKKRWLEKLSETSQAKDCRLLFLGDSITQGWENTGKAVWEKLYAPVQALNLGFSGDRTEHLLWRIKYGRLDKLRPRAAVMLIGTNNTGHLQRPAEETTAGIRAVIGEFQKHLPNTPLVMLSIFPRGERPDDPMRRLNDEINAKAKKLADGSRVIWLDLSSMFFNPDKTLSKEIMPDFLHLSPAAYERWAKGLEPVLKRLGLNMAM
jgi:lysophospholipase L1-like esterase